MRLTLNYIVTANSARIYPCDTNTFTHNLKNTFITTENLNEVECLNEVFLESRFFPFTDKINFNPKVISLIIFNKTVC